MNELVKFGQSVFYSILRYPGDSITAKVTKSGNQVIKADSKLQRVSLTRYPSTGTIVKTEVYRER